MVSAFLSGVAGSSLSSVRTTPSMSARRAPTSMQMRRRDSWEPFLASMSPFIDMMTAAANDMTDTNQSPARNEFGVFFPRGSIVEHENEYLVKYELPGFSKENIELSIRGDFAVISGKHTEQVKSADISDNEEKAETADATQKSWSTSRTFVRQFSLRKDVDRSAISATVKDGILTVTLPKIKAAVPEYQRIEIQ